MKRLMQTLAALCMLMNYCVIIWADQINDYTSKITVLDDGTIDVVETIQVFTNHEQIRLGLTRDIPTHYYFMNKRVETPVDVLSVTRNGQSENFWTENNDSYVEIFTGSVDNVVDNYLDKGKHTFVLHWQSKNHIRSFEHYDELYFNAIGHNWRLPILNAMVTLYLPNSVKEIQSSAYYGANGAKNLGEVIVKSPQEIQFIAPSVLGNGRGFTVATGFTKGMIPSIQPSNLDSLVDHLYGKLPSYIQPMNIILGFIMVLLAMYYWIIKRINASLSPTIKRLFTVRFEPPTVSLAELFASMKPHNEEYNRAILATLLSMHTQGIIRINQNAKIIELGKTNIHPSSFEQKIIRAIKQQKIGLSFAKDSKPWAELMRALRLELSSLNEQCYPETMKWAWYGVFPLVIVMIVVSVTLLFIPAELFFSLIFMGIALQALLIPSLDSIWEQFRSIGLVKGILMSVARLPFLLFGMIFLTVPFFVMFSTTIENVDVRDLVMAFLLIVLTLVIIRKLLMKIYSKTTVLNKKYAEMRQELMEFKHFLLYTKYEEYKIVTPDLFEQYLPYSIILGIENQWIQRFKDYYPAEFARSNLIVLSQASQNSLSHSVSSASSATTSRGYGAGGFGSGGSGSGGGGSSGGGSGGGGGGGR